MGYHAHHSIVVTSWDRKELRKAHRLAKKLFGPMCSPILGPFTNDFTSFFVAPDGSKEGWAESVQKDNLRRALLEYLNSVRYEDHSSCLRWFQVEQNDDHQCKVTHHTYKSHRP